MRCIHDTNGDGDCQHCCRKGGCRALGGPFDSRTTPFLLVSRPESIAQELDFDGECDHPTTDSSDPY